MTDNVRGKMLTIETKGDRTLFFDLLPVNLGKVGGFDIRIQLYTVPGQSIYEATRKLVLKGVDGIVFVADSLRVRQTKNIESLKELEKNLNEINKPIGETPVVLQFNKRDLASSPIPILSVKEMENDLNKAKNFSQFETSATKGLGVFETLREISKLTVRQVANKHIFSQSKQV
jgi:signal recognition particle receptor subunit beta